MADNNNVLICNTEEILHRAIRDDPMDSVAWAALKDWHIEQGRDDIPWKRERHLIRQLKGMQGTNHSRFAWRIAEGNKDPEWEWDTVEYIQVTMQEWIACSCGWIVNLPLLKRVRIVDRKPEWSEHRKEYTWWRSDGDGLSEIPRYILTLMPHSGPLWNGFRDFQSVRAARLALSDACIAWAKQEAGVG